MLRRGGLWVGHLLHETVENNVATVAVAVRLLQLLLLLMMMIAVRGFYRNGVRKISSSSGSSSGRSERQIIAFCCYRASISCSCSFSCSCCRILTSDTLT